MIHMTVDMVRKKEVEKFLNGLPHRFNQALSNAINETATRLRREAKKEIKKELEIKNDTEEYKMQIRRASVFSGQMVAELVMKGGYIPLAHMSGVSQGKTGVTFNILKKAHTLPGTFIATMAADPEHFKGATNKDSMYNDIDNEHTGIFKRYSASRLPLKEKYTASIPQMAVSEKTDIPEELQKKANEIFEKVFAEECEEQLTLAGLK
jgi:hypothetical protein